MRTKVANLTANGRSEPITVNIARSDGEAALTTTVFAFGTFGSGTLALEVSPDGGSTWIPVTESGIAVALTSDGVRNVKTQSSSGNSSNNGEADFPVTISVILSGSTAPTIEVVFYHT